MGLDMYLNAKRSLDDHTATTVLAMLSDDERTKLHDDGNYYAGMWEYYDRSVEGSERKKRAEAVMTEAGLMTLVTSDSPGGELTYENGVLVASVHGCYWRKANAIHSWFVQNCQDGVDECQESPPIPAEQLAHLAHTCQQAIDAYDAGDLERAGEILTPTSGFFFGSTEVGEWWAEDVRRTILEIEVLVRKAIAIGGVTFTYQSSW